MLLHAHDLPASASFFRAGAVCVRANFVRPEEARLIAGRSLACARDDKILRHQNTKVTELEIWKLSL